jgi:DNA-binding NtrC family response regulator
VITGSADKGDAIRALKLGAFDFFEKPVDREDLLETIKKTMRYRTLLRERDLYAAQLAFFSQREQERWGVQTFVGKGKAVSRIVHDVQLVQKAARTSVLVMGESGTGKELIARAIHYGSPRASQPFVPINCSAVPKELAESALFGHMKGSFTGATADKKGCFQIADGGTLFLDEIGDMPSEMQTKLLRVLEDGDVTPVGASKGTRVDVRVIAATNSNLVRKIADGTFRSDLYYRLATFVINLPTLRERRGDIPLLAQHFIEHFAGEMGVPVPSIDTAAVQILESFNFPGNVRELRNVVERAMIESGGGDIHAEHIECCRIVGSAEHPAAVSAPCLPADAIEDLPLNLKQAESVLVQRAMNAAEGNVSAAARMLGVNRTRLYRMMATHGTGS